MKKLILIYLIFLATPAFAESWSQSDINREIGFQALYFYDYQQTLSALRYWQFRKVHFLAPSIEKNQYLTNKANEEDITTYFIITGLTHWAISAMLPQEMRERWQWLSIGYVASDIHSNLQLGFHWRF